MGKSREYVGIHSDRQSVWLERIEAPNSTEAYFKMERNDTYLLVMDRVTFDKLHTIELPMNTMVLVS